jgi:hypothetical protein
LDLRLGLNLDLYGKLAARSSQLVMSISGQRGQMVDQKLGWARASSTAAASDKVKRAQSTWGPAAAPEERAVEQRQLGDSGRGRMEAGGREGSEERGREGRDC